ncbi:hypothetical protein [Bradyrhizobium sp. JR3.5]
MFPAKIYIGQITAVFGIVIASTWGATQWTAAALDRFLNPERDASGDAALIRRLDRMSRQLERADRDVSVLAETIALFIRYYLTITPPLPSQDQDAARALGRERFEMFVAQVGKRGRLRWPACRGRHGSRQRVETRSLHAEPRGGRSSGGCPTQRYWIPRAGRDG